MATARLYPNLRELIRYRGQEPAAPELGLSEVTQILAQDEHLRLDGTGGLTLLLLSEKSGACRRKAELLKLLRPVGEGREIMVVGPPAALKRKNLLPALEKHRARLYPYTTFAAVVPQAAAVPAHRLVTAEEAAARLQAERLPASALPQISSQDPPVAWLGGRAGDFVEVRRDSETAGRAVVLRRVV